MFMKITTYFTLLFFPLLCFSQDEGDWDVYLADYEDGVGSTMVRMDLFSDAPIKEYEFLLVAGAEYKNCIPEGLPSPEAFEYLYQVDDSIINILASHNPIYTGIFSHKCERLNFFYLKDTMNIREKLAQMHSKNFSKLSNPHIEIKLNKEWEAYKNFLYPSEEIQRYMADQKVILHLQSAGDNLETPRQVDHWIYFPSIEDRKGFYEKAKEMGYAPESASKIENAELPYQLVISKSTDVRNIYEDTSSLNALAKEFNGDYDGWETFIITE